MKKAVIGGVMAAGIAAGAIGLAAPAQSASNAKTIPLTVKNFKFGVKTNNVLKAKVGDSLKFTWVQGQHNVVGTTHPSGTTKANSGSPKTGRAPFTVKLTKKGKYIFICTPHQALGMKVTVTVS
jgi:plastocyanin